MPPSTRTRKGKSHRGSNIISSSKIRRHWMPKSGGHLSGRKPIGPSTKATAPQSRPLQKETPTSSQGKRKYTKDQQQRLDEIQAPEMVACAEPHDVWCVLCGKPTRLDKRYAFQFNNWRRHVERCIERFLKATMKRLACDAKQAEAHRITYLKEEKAVWSKDKAIESILRTGTQQDKEHLFERGLITREQVRGQSLPSQKRTGEHLSTTSEEPPCRKRKLLHVNTENVEVYQSETGALDRYTEGYAGRQQGATERRCLLESTPPRLVRIASNLREEKATSGRDSFSDSKVAHSATGLSNSELTEGREVTTSYMLHSVSSWSDDDDDDDL